MAIPHYVFVAGGAAAADVLRGFVRKGRGRKGAAVASQDVHDALVSVVAYGMRIADKVSAATRSIADEASDINVEARRQARIDAAVEERLVQIEKDVRAEVTAEVDGAGMDE